LPCPDTVNLPQQVGARTIDFQLPRRDTFPPRNDEAPVEKVLALPLYAEVTDKAKRTFSVARAHRGDNDTMRHERSSRAGSFTPTSGAPL